MCARDVAADNQLLAGIQAVFRPCSTAFPGFVTAISPLCYHAFQSLLAGALEHCPGGYLEILGDADLRRPEFEGKLQDFSALDEWELREVAILIDQQIKHEIADA